MIKSILHSTLLILCVLTTCAAQPVKKAAVNFNETEFRDRVYACWLAKNIGGTLGMRFEGARVPHSLTYFDPVPEKPAANDDLDLQILWLKALEEKGININARTLGEYWLQYVPVNWNEYGIGKANMRDGFLPPTSGQFRNKQWRDSNGAWIRSEIWACLAPGCPSLAVKYAYEDACVDHGAAEGTYAEMFTAAVESAAFVESDRDKLISIGLSYIPRDCSLAKSIRTAIDARAKGLDWAAAREAVIKSSESTGWFQAPRNVGFVIVGWLYGEDDFGKSICAAINCGDDTDCTGATLGSILGIIHGSKCISQEWRKPVGEGIQNVAISGFKGPATLDELTDHTVSMTKTMLRAYAMPVQITAAPTNLAAKGRLKLRDTELAQRLWARSPYQLAYNLGKARATFDYAADPEIRQGEQKHVALRIENTGRSTIQANVTWKISEGLTGKGVGGKIALKPGEQTTLRCDLAQATGADSDRVVKSSVTVACGTESVEIPFSILCHGPAKPETK